VATIRIGSFGGMLPAVDENLLPDTAAHYAENCFLYSGALRPLPKPKDLHTLVDPSAGFVYRIPKSYTDADYLYESTWMEFASPNTNVIRSQVFQDIHDRYYFFSDSFPPRYNTHARITNKVAGVPTPLPPFLLGINPPSVPPGVTFSGGVDVVNARAYVYTWVSAYGEESAPSPPTNVKDKIDATYTVTCAPPPLADQGTDRNLTKIRLYRTVTSDSGVATFFFVEEKPLAGAASIVFTDTATDADIALNEQISSTFYTPPPANLVGAVAMPNGMVTGWTQNDIWFCEPYRMHAWPAKYGQTVEYPIVGLGVLGQSCVVCTQGYPSVATGTDPAFISMAKLTVFEPCLSRGSILSSPEGVYYASPSGLQLVGPGVIDNITRDAATKDKWQKLTVLSRLRAARLGTAYYAFGSTQIGVFDEEDFDPLDFEQEDLSGAYIGILIDPAVANVGIVQLTSPIAVVNVLTDPWSGELFQIKGGKVWWLDMVDIETSLEVVYWNSKVFQTNQVRNFGALKLYFDVLPGTPPGALGRVKVLADGHHVAMDRPLVKSGQLMRPSSGWKADFWQLLLTCQVKIKSVQMANSVKELNDV